MNRIAIWHYAQFGRNHPVSYCPLRGQLKHQSGLFNTCGDSMLRVVKKPGCCAHHDQELNGFVLPSDITDRLFGWFLFVCFSARPGGTILDPPSNQVCQGYNLDKKSQKKTTRWTSYNFLFLIRAAPLHTPAGLPGHRK